MNECDFRDHKVSDPHYLLKPAFGSVFKPSSDLSTKTELNHSQWALGFPCHLVLTSSLAVRIGGFDIFSQPSGGAFRGYRWLGKMNRPDPLPPGSNNPHSHG